MTSRFCPRFRVLAVLVCLAVSGCASPYRFSPRLHAPGTGDAAGTVPPRGPMLAGDLDLALGALTDQRRLLWEAAGEVETMKNATALGLIGLASVGLYRGLESEGNRTWLTKAGLLASATYAGAAWLEPGARQKIYLQGAVSLTCLALATAPYELPKDEYLRIRQAIAESRTGLERLATTLRLVGRYEPQSETYRLVRGGWNKLRWANRVLDAADSAVGTIEATGPRLRDMTALLASDVATQVHEVSRDLSQLQVAIGSLKPNVNALIGTEIFKLPEKAAINEEPGEGGDDSAGKEAAASTAPQCEAATSPPPPAGGAGPTPAPAPTAPRPPAPTPAPTAAASPAWVQKLNDATAALDASLGTVASFVQRVGAARRDLSLPKACQADTAVALVPEKREILLYPGESFQFVLQGDTGKAGADFVGQTVGRDVLDLAMPLSQSSTAVRLTAGSRVPQPVNTVVRISTSRGHQQFDIAVKVCPS